MFLTFAAFSTIQVSRSEPTRTRLLADFEKEEDLESLLITGLSIAHTKEDVVTGTGALEVKVRPFSVHKNHWPRVILGTEYFPEAFDLSTYSKVVVTIRNVTEGLPPVKLSMTSLPYNDGGRNWDDRAWYIPEGESMLCEFPTAAVQRHMNDISSIRMMMFVLPDNEIDAIYRIDSIQAVYDPAEGSPAETLEARARSVKQQLAATAEAVNWDLVPEALRKEVEPRIPEFNERIARVLAATAAAGQGALAGKYNELRNDVEDIERKMGALVLADKKDFFAWELRKYLNIYKNEPPDLASPKLESIDVRMAMDEFRDAAFMVSSVGKDLRLSVEVKPSRGLPAESIQVRESLYFSFGGGREELGDVLFDLDGPLDVPKGESRQVWLTFNTRYGDLKPGDYTFDVVLRDQDTGTEQTVPGKLTVWNFALPSADILANNGYVELFNSEVGLKIRDKAVAHMKRYGLNMVLVYWNYMPFPIEVDEDLSITAYDSSRLKGEVEPVVGYFNAAPGSNERLRFILQLSYITDRLVHGTDVPYPSESFKKVFAQWLKKVERDMASWGVKKEDYVFFLADESNMEVLLNFELPLAELIKEIDPEIQVFTNRGPGIRGREDSFRFYKTFDAMLSRGDRDEQYPFLAEWIEKGNEPPELWTYKASSMADRVNNYYAYYRVSGWMNFKHGIVGPGVWTYCARGTNPWSENKEMVGHCLVYKHKDHDEVVHSRRYEFYREGNDDYRYLYLLRELAGKKDASTKARAEHLIQRAIADIEADVTDTTRCENWRLKIADTILKLKASGG
jgi:hypothetical protein